MEKNQEVTNAAGAVGRLVIYDSLRWRGFARGGAVDGRDEAIRRLTDEGLSRRAIAKVLGVNRLVVVRVQRAGGAS